MRLFFYFFIFLFLSFYILPVFGASDKAAVQWLAISLLGFLGFIYFVITKSFKFKFLLNFLPFRLYSLFILLSILSIFYSDNIIISFHEISHLLSLYLVLILFFNLSFNTEINFTTISLSIVSFGFIEAFFSLYPLINLAFNNFAAVFNLVNLDVNLFIGVTGNRNITTASLIVKIPFVFYLFYKYSGIKQFLIFLLSSFILLPIFLISSRSALLSLTLISISLFCFNFYKNSSFLTIKSYVLILFSIALSFIASLYIIPTAQTNGVKKLASIEITNQSSSNRFELWSNAIDYIYNNPIIGSGIGNWKVNSAAYWGSLGESYLVPYHAHNDFLHYTTELGLSGGLVYLALFLLLFYYCYKILRTNALIAITLFCSLLAYFVDSNLNFPYDRPIMQIMFILLIFLITKFKTIAYEK